MIASSFGRSRSSRRASARTACRFCKSTVSAMSRIRDDAAAPCLSACRRICASVAAEACRLRRVVKTMVNRRSGLERCRERKSSMRRQHVAKPRPLEPIVSAPTRITGGKRKGKEKGEKKKKKGYSRIRPCNKNYRLRLQWLCGGIAKDTPPISQRRFAHSPKLSDFSFSEG